MNNVIRDVAVIGLGTMGSGIAQVFAAAGFNVRCFDEVADALSALPSRIEANLKQMSDAGLDAREPIPQILQRIHLAKSEHDAVANAQFVVEAVREDLQTKRDLFARLEATTSPDTILATNTSSLRLADMSDHLVRRDRLLVTHWFNPPHIVPLVEVVPGPDTSTPAMDTTMALMSRIGKRPVRLSREIPGFIVNRVQVAMLREVWHLYEQGIASAEDIDEAIRGSMGFRLAASGPLEINDFGGLDIWKSVYENLAPKIASDSRLPEFLRKKVESGHLGAKTGSGIYEYTKESLEERRAERDRRFLQLAKLFYSETSDNV